MSQTVRLTELKIPIGESGKAYIEVDCVGQLIDGNWQCVQVSDAYLYLAGDGIDITESLNYRQIDMRALVAAESEAFVTACENELEEQRCGRLEGF